MSLTEIYSYSPKIASLLQFCLLLASAPLIPATELTAPGGSDQSIGSWKQRTIDLSWNFTLCEQDVIHSFANNYSFLWGCRFGRERREAHSEAATRDKEHSGASEASHSLWGNELSGRKGGEESQA